MRLGHPSPRQLIRLTDDDLPPRQSARVLAHLHRCAPCRAELLRIEELLNVYAAECQRELPLAPGLADHDEARGRLQARLAVDALQPAPARWHWQWVAAFPLALLAVSVWLPRHPATALLQFDGGLLPNPHLTPGAAQPVALGALCSREDVPFNRAVAPSLQQRVLREYGLHQVDPANFEVDYLITPGLGGTANIRNLWPEPRAHATWNSYVKDQLEQYLQRSVCQGDLPLATAQHAIARNWIQAYKFYFHTDQPQPANARAARSAPVLALLERPWI